MVVKMMKWRPWPPLISKKFEVRLTVRRLMGLSMIRNGPTADLPDFKEKGEEKYTVEIRWKGQKVGLSSFKRSVKRNYTKEASFNGVYADWHEEFQSVCCLSAYKDNALHPWEITFVILNGLKPGGWNKGPAIGSASLNLADLASQSEKKDFDLSLPVLLPSVSLESNPSLLVSLSLVELRTSPEQTDPVQVPAVPLSSPSLLGDSIINEKDDVSALKAGLRKVKIFTEYVSSRKSEKSGRDEGGCEGRFSAGIEYGEYSSFDSDSVDHLEDSESDEVKEASNRKSFSYGTLAYANCVGGISYQHMMNSGDDADMVYYSNRKSDVGCLHVDDISASDQSLLQTSKKGLLSWKKRKLSFRSPKPKGEPLLKKAYAEEGGDDIDYDRRMLSPDNSLALEWCKNEDVLKNNCSVSEFGDDNFAVGLWENKEVVSRDGQMKLKAQVFFASIDQRSEKAAGESACTALVAVIADWFQNNPNLMPIKSQFDCLIREGSKEWRNLCDNESYREQFPDKHFDLETVLQSKIRPLSVASGKSFIGFFHPQGLEEERFDFLHGAMFFDNIWDEINRAASVNSSLCGPQVYIISWNDHFFILKVESEAYYIIDTLGERLHEGCQQAYILKFDKDTVLYKLPDASSSSDETTLSEQSGQSPANASSQTLDDKSVSGSSENSSEEPLKGKEEEIVCRGKESCKEYIKSFLAAIPIRELQTDIRKGLMASTPLHHRLQIEFHYTNRMQQKDVACLATC